MDLPPLCYVDGFSDPGYLVNERDGSRNVVEGRDIPDLFPRHQHVL